MTLRLSAASFRCLTVACAAAGLAGVPRVSAAQDAQPAAAIAELRQRLDEIERTMQAQVAALRQQIADLEGDAAAQARARRDRRPPPLSARRRRKTTFSRDRESVARVNNQPLDPALQGFLSIPGTPARLKFDGYAKLDTIIDAKPAGNTDQFVPSSIPIGLTDAQRVASTTHARAADAAESRLPQPDRIRRRFPDATRRSTSSAPAARSTRGCGTSTARC